VPTSVSSILMDTICDFVHKNPGCTLSDIMVAIRMSHQHIQTATYKLVDERRIRRVRPVRDAKGIVPWRHYPPREVQDGIDQESRSDE